MSTFDTARAATYDQGANAAIIGHDALYEVVMAVLAGHSMRRVLVLGAGTGKETIMLRSRYPQLELVAVDPSEPMLEVAREKLAAQGLTADVRCGYLHQ
jgi:tRNA (cmo5U34)-methyltransferase